ncbi:hypothetical protein ABIB35_001794 [Arthrobacter sp. UYP6]|uniref:hypothetical protein n=1 Tax=Arthrobacter sp. UYP6 TaxID=1756378 RepID=UPI003394C7AE
MGIPGENKELNKPNNLLMMVERAGPRFFYAVLIALMLALYFWGFHRVLPVASVFLALGIAYGVLLFRVVSLSGRASMAMSLAWILIYYSMFSVQNALAIPAAGPWFIGFLVGGIAGGHVWSGPRAGTVFKRKHQRRRNADGSFPGGWRLALANGCCALLLLGLGAGHFLLQSPTMPVGILLACSSLSGWALFRFGKTTLWTFVPLWASPLLFLVLLLLGGATGQLALGMVFAYGLTAGILIGGRYWAGDRFGEPRPPFAGQGPRRRRKRRSKQIMKKKKTGRGHILSASGVPTP